MIENTSISNLKKHDLFAPERPAIIKTVNLRKVYRSFHVETVGLESINVEIKEGEFVSIMGPSGSGKSTLLNLLAMLDKPSSGSISFMGTEVSTFGDRQRAQFRKRFLGFIFQSFNLIDELTILENVELPLQYLGLPKAERRKRAMEMMERLEVAHKKHFFPSQLSGGQQQRVAVARAVVTNPYLLLADEPTGNLDSAHGQEVMDILSKLNENGTTVILVTHSAQNAEYSQRTIHLFDGQVVTENINHVN